VDTSPMKGKPKVEATSCSTEMYNPPPVSILRVFKERGEKKLLGRKGQFQPR